MKIDWHLRWAELAEKGGFVYKDTHIDLMIQSYSNRHYHSLNHIQDMLLKLDKWHHLVPNLVEAELIIWFHDIAKSEKESANIATQILTEAEFKGDIELIQDGILATDHVTNRITDDWKEWPLNKMITIMVICDLDLTILGGTQEEYEIYQKGIRQEHIHVPEMEFLNGRLQVLQYFNRPKSIFITEHIRAYYESKARINIAKEITAIQKRLVELQSL